MNEDKEQAQVETQETSSCGEDEFGTVSEVFQSEVAKDLFVPAITFNWGRKDLKKCEWREGYLTIFQDSRYEGKMNLRCNKGVLFSCDSMETEFQLYVGGTVVFSFQAPTESVAGNDDEDIYYYGRGEAIKSYFNQIDGASRRPSGYCS